MSAAADVLSGGADAEVLVGSFRAFVRALGEFVARAATPLLPAPPATTHPEVMTVAEYARHAKCSVRKLAYLRTAMTEGVHYSRVGRRVRFHVTEVDAFLRTLSSRERDSEVTGDHAVRQLARARNRGRPNPHSTC